MKKILLSGAFVATTLIIDVAHSQLDSVQYLMACMWPCNFGVLYTDS